MADTKLSALTAISVPALADPLYGEQGGSSGQYTLTRTLGILNSTCEGRLTLTSGTAVTTSDVTGATSIYFTPYNGQCVALYDGTRWRMYVFTELTLALGTLTSGLPYDVFLYDNSGTLTLEALAWTNGTTRATAIDLQDGVYCKHGALTRRYLGTFYTTATTTTEDSVAKRFVWNMYNRVQRPMQFVSANSSWTYNSTTYHAGDNGNSSARLQFVLGLAEVAVNATIIVETNAGATGEWAGIGLDRTNGNDAALFGLFSGSVYGSISGEYLGFPGIGFHYLSWVEAVRSGTGTFFGTADGSGGSCGTGLYGRLMG